MKPFQQRVVQEKDDLADKMHKLATFFETPDFANLSDAEQARLENQYQAMKVYCEILRERIFYFKEG